jgi:hypothetical protein
MADLQDFKDDLAREAHGMTTAEAHAKGICINCQKPPRFKTEMGRREYRISGMCEYCFDDLFEETEEDYADDDEAPAF